MIFFTPGGMKTLFPIFENCWFAKQELAGVDVVVALLLVLFKKQTQTFKHKH